MTRTEKTRRYYLKHRARILAKQKELRQMPKIREYQRQYQLRYGTTPQGKQAHRKALEKFIQSHPLYSIHYLEAMLRITERNGQLNTNDMYAARQYLEDYR